MFRISFVACLLGVLMTAYSAFAQDQRHDDSVGRAERQLELQTVVESLISPLVKQDMISGSVLIARNGEILVDYGFGLADREHGSPNLPTTPYRIASVSKSITAVATLQLVERGLIGLDDTLESLLPGFENGEQITVAHLLAHRSGIPSDVYLPEFGQKSVLGDDLAGAVNWVRSAPARFDPGEKFEYSNSGYLVLSAIIEKVSGMPYERYLSESIFARARMTSSGLDSADSLLEGRARGYRRTEFGTVAPTAYRDPSFGWGYGALYSTTRDLFGFAQALGSGELLSRESMALMLAPRSVTPWRNQYGLGWFIDELGGETVVSAVGATGGFVATVRLVPETDTVVVALLNHDFLMYQELFDQLLLIASNRPGTPLFGAEAADASTDLSAVIGEYEMDDGEITVLESVNGEFRFGVKSTGAYFDAYILSDSEAYVPAQNARLRFRQSDDGAVELLALYGNYAWRGNRIPRHH